MPHHLVPRAVVAASLSLALAAGCAPGTQTGSNTAAQPSASPGVSDGAQGWSGAPNTLTAQERAAGWRLLFDGTSAGRWRAYRGTALGGDWRIADGTLMKTRPTDDIVYDQPFGDFELVMDWKVSPGGNAGLFYRGSEEMEKIYFTAPEYQLLDDPGHRDGGNRLTAAGAAYGLYPAPVGVVRPANEWNTTRVVARGAHVEHWLNGQKLLEYEMWSPDWEAKVKASKFVEWPKYGRARSGLIAIQGDHGGLLALRNIKIRELR
jgi:hypothetical protein